MESDTHSHISLIIWPNGKSIDSIYKIKIDKRVDNLKKLKEALVYEKNYSKSLIDKIIFYNYKGMEIDDSDVAYLQNDQILYLAYDGNRFSLLNYVNEYQYIKPIKKGGYAEVYLAKHAITKQLVAIKKTDLHNFSAEELYNISREAVYLINLTNTNIVKMYNSYTYDNCLYNVMAYCEGGELTQLLIDSAPIPEKRIKNIFFQIQNAVKYIHDRNVVHRDLKPNNLLFLDKEQTHVVLIDFGISGMNTGFNKEIVKAGTLKYTPPELLSSEKFQSNTKIDIWALGVILYLLNFKDFPFDGKDDSIVIDKIITKPVEFPKGKKVKVTLYNLIKGLLNKDPAKRIEITDELFNKWYNDESEEYMSFEKERKTNANHASIDFSKGYGGKRMGLSPKKTGTGNTGTGTKATNKIHSNSFKSPNKLSSTGAGAKTKVRSSKFVTSTPHSKPESKK